MLSVKSCDLPEKALLVKYKNDQVGYTDCYSATVDGLVQQKDFIHAFYTSVLFKVERVLLKYLVNKPSSDKQAMQLANGDTEKFSAWYVESRTEHQLLMCDFQNRTRSWLMVTLV